MGHHSKPKSFHPTGLVSRISCTLLALSSTALGMLLLSMNFHLKSGDPSWSSYCFHDLGLYFLRNAVKDCWPLACRFVLYCVSGWLVDSVFWENNGDLNLAVGFFLFGNFCNIMLQCFFAEEGTYAFISATPSSERKLERARAVYPKYLFSSSGSTDGKKTLSVLVHVQFLPMQTWASSTTRTRT